MTWWTEDDEIEELEILVETTDDPEEPAIQMEVKKPAPDGETATRPVPLPAPSRGGAENTYVAIYGKKGMGKTLLAREIFLSRVRNGGDAAFVDRTKKNGDLGTVVELEAELLRYLRAQLSSRAQLRFVVAPKWGDSELPWLWRRLYDVGQLLVVLDEAETFANAHRIDSDLAELVNLGRNQEIDMVFVVRTPPELSKRVKGNLDVAISFRQEDPAYAAQLAEEHFPSLPDGPRRLLTLPRLHYLRSEHGKVTTGRVWIPGTKPSSNRQ